MNYPDTLTLVDPVIDEYGTEKIGRMETVKCIFGQTLGYSQGNRQAQITSDAIAYIDPTHFFVQSAFNRLEGMLVITQEGEAATDAWYRIESVSVGRASLLDNRLDNIQVNLKKTVSIPSVS